VAGSFSTGATWAWYSNSYDWRAFLAALGCSLAGSVLWMAGAALVPGRKGPGVSVLMYIPGMKYVTGTPDWDPLENYKKTWSGSFHSEALVWEDGDISARKDVEVHPSEGVSDLGVKPGMTMPLSAV